MSAAENGSAGLDDDTIRAWRATADAYAKANRGNAVGVEYARTAELADECLRRGRAHRAALEDEGTTNASGENTE